MGRWEGWLAAVYFLHCSMKKNVSLNGQSKTWRLRDQSFRGGRGRNREGRGESGGGALISGHNRPLSFTREACRPAHRTLNNMTNSLGNAEQARQLSYSPADRSASAFYKRCKRHVFPSEFDASEMEFD